MDYVEIGFVAELEGRRSDLPPFVGATLRGALGHLLKRTVCQISHGICDRCLLQRACPYPAIFEGVPPANRNFMRNYPRVPQPFVLVVPPPDAADEHPDRLHWGIRLFGQAAGYWPYVVHVFRTAGEEGIGRHRLRYRFVDVMDRVSGSSLGIDDEGPSESPTSRSVESEQLSVPGECRLRWRFETPLRIGRDGESSGLPLGGLELVLAGRRRYRIMRTFYDNGSTTDGEPIEERFPKEAFQVVSASLRSWGITRYSGRQKRSVPLSGLLGEMVIAGPWGHVGPALHAVKTIHLGKSSSFGLGRVDWEVV